MSTVLTETEIRVVGSLVEKQLTTPEYYPLTLNALTAACNQKSNRDPVMSLSETEIMAAVDRLRDENLVYLFYGSGSRTVKYKHMLPSVYELDAAGTAVMAVLMLRGPQTIGEIRERSGRMHEFGDLNEVQATLDDLSRRDEPLIVKLDRQPGQKEARYAHLLSGPVDVTKLAAAAERTSSAGSASNDRIEKLETEVERLSSELAEFKAVFDEFRKQFD
ncbi:MAG: YceH family protein [Pyrinomonadaceae bacterium]|nr:YceH family protein [Blastocatellia bacterium]MCW5958208.1 YceH family protein [Pyrinomonadaceae bacterium]